MTATSVSLLAFEALGHQDDASSFVRRRPGRCRLDPAQGNGADAVDVVGDELRHGKLDVDPARAPTDHWPRQSAVPAGDGEVSGADDRHVTKPPGEGHGDLGSGHVHVDDVGSSEHPPQAPEGDADRLARQHGDPVACDGSDAG